MARAHAETGCSEQEGPMVNTRLSMEANRRQEMEPHVRIAEGAMLAAGRSSENLELRWICPFQLFAQKLSAGCRSRRRWFVVLAGGRVAPADQRRQDDARDGSGEGDEGQRSGH